VGSTAEADRRRAEIRERLEAVRARIARAAHRAGRDPAAVRLVAVGKGFPVEDLAAAVEAGAEDLGENYVQEALAKMAALRGPRWHLIGQLQRRKARQVVGRFACLHGVDRPELVEALAAAAGRAGVVQDVLIQVSLAGRPGQGGVAPERALDLVRAVHATGVLRAVGLMTIAPPGPEPEAARPWFRSLRALRDRLQEATGWPLPELSMGMTDDFEVAVEEGATMVRVGRALFGPRPTPPAQG
jgi:pyridoxal phosphate enzyme (YggS family)